MKKLLSVAALCSLAYIAGAQTAPGVQPFGKIDKSDLELKQCDFEKDANAEILFAKAEVAPEGVGQNQFLAEKRHVRVKIFNDDGKSMANVTITFYSKLEAIAITDLQAQTINLVNDKVEITPLDKKQVFVKKLDKWYSEMTFTLPNVKAGSVIEYKYRVAGEDFPKWYFQNYIPTRYSEIDVNIPSFINFKSVPHVKQEFVKNQGEGADAVQVRAMANIHSMPREPYMGSRDDSRERIEYIWINTNVSTWQKIGERMMLYNDFGYDLDRNLSGEDEIVKKAKTISSMDSRIAYVFGEVKKDMKWDNVYRFYTFDGTVKAWDKKSGNSTEINMILYHLLKKSGVKVYPLVVSTKGNGKVNPANPTMSVFNNTVVFCPIDSSSYYVMDASNKYGLYNTIPANILNSFGFLMDPGHKDYKPMFIENTTPAIQSVLLNAEIKPGGKIAGNVEITSYAYNKIKVLQSYNDVDEKKYKDSITHNDNNLKIASLKLENMDIDSLPVTQKIEFNEDLAGSDENYIYLNTNLFNPIGENPFKKEQRFSDIDLGYLDNYSIYGVYKLPVGFKTDALPKNISIVMPDQSMVFKRTVTEDDGSLLVKYTLIHRKAIYFQEEYPDLRNFYAKLYELLNEQVVLKKS